MEKGCHGGTFVVMTVGLPTSTCWGGGAHQHDSMKSGCPGEHSNGALDINSLGKCGLSMC